MSTQRWMREDFRLDVECGLCGFTGVVDGWEDAEISKWGWDCPGCDFPHSHYIDEHGAASWYAAVLMFVAALGVIGAWGHYWPLFWAALWVFLGLLFIALFIGANNNDQPEEGDHE